MVERYARTDDVFRALADPTRRSLLQTLAAGDRTVGELAAGFPVSFQAVSKHVKVLEAAGLVLRTRRGRTHRLRLAPRPLRLVERWTAEIRKYWDERLDALEAHLRATGRGRRRSSDG